MTADLYSTRIGAPLSIRKDAQPSRNGVFAKWPVGQFLLGVWGMKSPQQA